jgi:hypothetical protein
VLVGSPSSILFWLQEIIQKRLWNQIPGYYLIALFFVALAGCSNPTPTVQPVPSEPPTQAPPTQVTTTQESPTQPSPSPIFAYPAPLDAAAVAGEYPQPEQPAGEAYPAPVIQPTAQLDVVPFRINKPIQAGATEVSGTGPPGLPIVIADVNFMGEILGEGEIGADGTFAIKLGIPLEVDHRIGIALNDLTGTLWESNDFSDPGFFGEEYRQVPTVGFFYDTAAVGGE